MKKVALFIALALSLGTALEARAQNGLALGKDLEKALKAKDAKRKIKESVNAGDHVQQDWLVDGLKVSVYVYEYSSPEEAARNMALAMSGVAYAEVSEALPNLGDEAHVFTNKRGTSTSLTIRKGGVYIVIEASSLKVAKKFAKDIADQLALR
jgi:hypothetical protein